MALTTERKAEILSTYSGRMDGGCFGELSRRSPDYERYASRLRNQGFRINEAPNGATIEWEQKPNDFARMDEAIKLVRDSLSLSDAEYRTHVLPSIEFVLGGKDASEGSLFHMLDDGKTRKMANGYDGSHTPFKHSMVVSTLARSSENVSLRFVQRVSNIFHDLGKVGLVPGDKDEETWHAEWSYLFLQDYFFAPSRFDGYSEEQLEEVDLILRAVRYHHILEQIEKNIMEPSNPQLLALFKDERLMEAIASLTDADTASVQGYERFRVEAISSLLQIFTELQRQGQQFGEEVIAFVQSHVQGLFELIRSLISEINDAILTTLTRYDTVLATAVDQGIGIPPLHALYEPMRRT